MKRTSSMKYNNSDEARELYLFAMNDSTIYHQAFIPACLNLRKKSVKGFYDSEKQLT